MKAVVCREHGDLSVLQLEDVPPPDMMPQQVRVRIRACGVNFADSLIVAGKYQTQPALPLIPGFEVAGDIVDVGADVRGWKKGDRVIVGAGSGGYAEQLVTTPDRLTPLPDSMDYVTAAAFPVAYGTSHLALKHRARLQAGEVLVVHGAAGGVGLTAVEIGKLLGATVIATAGGDAKLKVAKTAGADHLIDYLTQDIRTEVKALTGGRGADVIYDPVGGDVFDASLRCIAFEGRILIIGFAGGRIQQIPANHVMVKNVDIIGFNRGPYDGQHTEIARDSFADLIRWHAEGRIKPLVSATYPLEKAIQAIEDVTKRRTTGKVVVLPNP